MNGRKYWTEVWENSVTGTNHPIFQKGLKAIFRSASLIYGVGVQLRNSAYDLGLLSVKKVSPPVISFGNLSMGGTGKTELVMWCADFLKKNGKKPVVLSRGYLGKESSNGPTILFDGKALNPMAGKFGDEPFLIAEKLLNTPVIVGSKRILSANLAVSSFKPDCIVMDDGFQHRSLHRNLDIVLMDNKMFKAFRLFPGGYLRESIKSLKRAHFIIIKQDPDETPISELLNKYSVNLPKAEFSYEAEGFKENTTKKIHPVNWIKNRNIVALSGIANPASFESMVLKCQGNILDHKKFPDHYTFNKEELAQFLVESKKKDALLVTTEKDRVRMPEDYPIYSLCVSLKWKEGREELENKILETLQNK